MHPFFGARCEENSNILIYMFLLGVTSEVAVVAF